MEKMFCKHLIIADKNDDEPFQDITLFNFGTKYVM